MKLDRLQRAQAYNKLTELVHLDDRKSIKSLPLDKLKFAKQISKLKTKKVSEEEEDETVREGNLKQSKMNVFEQMFSK